MAAFKKHLLQSLGTKPILKDFIWNKPQNIRHYTVNSKIPTVNKSKVYISKSQDIYANLAFEDWIYKNVDLEKQNLLFLWRNNPCVVVGRHQNPWLECSVPYSKDNSIPIARRRSGGGTVFHDLGNLNCTFFTSKKSYKRPPNLQLVVDALTREWNTLDLKLGERDDILLENEFKVSGTAAKLGAKSAYHHFTLLFDTDNQLLERILQTDLVGATSKATESIPSTVKNIREAEPQVTFDRLVELIGNHYTECHGTNSNIEIIDPTDEAKFAGLKDLKEELENWEWIYGKTPMFDIDRTFVYNPAEESGNHLDKEGQNLASFLKEDIKLHLQVKVEKGKIADLYTILEAPMWGLDKLNNLLAEITIKLMEQRFCGDYFSKNVESNLVLESNNPLSKWIVQCFKTLLR